MSENPTGKVLRKDTLEWIEAHPELVKRIEKLQEISEDESADLETLEQAERAVIEEINRLGGEALRQWLTRKEAKASGVASTEKDLRRHSKKNSG
jgi:hypothetical protein